MLARSARQASLSVGTSAVRGNVRTENRRKLTASESRPLTRRFTFGVVSCWIAEIPWITGRDRPAPARLLQIAQSCGPGDEAVIQLCLFLRTAPSHFPTNSNARFPRRLRRPPSRPSFSHPRGGGVERRQAHSFFLLVARVRGATPALVRRGPVPVRPGPLSALHRGDFRPRTHAGVSGSGTPEPQRLPAPGRTAWRSGSGPPAVRFRAAVAGRDSWLRPQVVSGDVPS